MRNKTAALKRVFITLTILPALLSVTAKAQSGHATFVGTGSCSSSNCHGGVQPRKSSSVLQNEYGTWIRHDKHSKAYTQLLTDDAKRMSALLDLRPPHEEPLCLKCHSTYVPDEKLRGDKYQIEDGVSCESCHGAAEHWLESHTVQGATHSENLKNGLSDTVDLNTRAALCISCHYGNEEKRVTHDLYGAGHPRLRFELDTFGILQPKHWVVDADYLERKEPYVPLRAWLIGQATLAKATVTTLRTATSSHEGALPELSLFDCFSCHHSLTEEQWKHRNYGGTPGRLKLNLASLVTVQVASSALKPSVAQKLEESLKELHHGYKDARAAEAAKEIEEILIDHITPLFNQIRGDEETCLKVLQTLTQFAASSPWPTYELAEQTAMGIQATIATSLPISQRFEHRVKELFETLATPKAFNPENYVKAATRFNTFVKR